MKKLLAIFLALVMLLCVSACSTQQQDVAPATDASAPASTTESTPSTESSSTGEAKTLRLWMPPQAAKESLDLEFWNDVLTDWEKENNCTVDVTIVPWGSYEEKYLSGFTSGDGPDVGYMYNEMLYDYIDLGLIEPLDSYLTDADKDEYLMLSLGQINGQQYTMPFSPGYARVLFYNQDILDKAGVTAVPTTWQEFIDACLQIKEACPDVIPYGQNWGGDGIGDLNASFYPFMWSAGGSLMELDGTVTLLDNDGALQAAQLIYDLMYTYEVLPAETIGWAEDDSVQLMQNGEIAFLFASAESGEARFGDCGQDIRFSYGLGQTDPDAWATWSCADALVMNASSSDKALAWSLIKYITSPVVMERAHNELFMGTALTKSETNLLSDELVELYTHTDHLHALPVARNSNAVMASLKSNLQLMLLGELTPQQALENTVEYSRTLS